MKFLEIATRVGNLVEEKNKAYGSSFSKSGEILKILYPDGVRPHEYTDMLLIVRCLDKFFRIATSKNAFGESPWEDLIGYAICGASMQPEKEVSEKSDPRSTATPRLTIKTIRD